MKKKFVIPISIGIIVIAVFCIIDYVRDNYRLGRDLYDTTVRLEIQCSDYAERIEYLQKEYAKEEISEGYITHSFENAMLTSTSYFGFEDVPILDESREAWGKRFEEIYSMFVNKPDKEYDRIFANKADEITEFKNQMYSMAEEFRAFHENYSKLSEWERYSTSWKKERNKLTEAVGLP